MNSKVFVCSAPYGDSAAIETQVEALFAQLPAARRLSAGQKVLIKPNLLAKHTPDKAVTTHPDVLRAVILAVQHRGVTDIVVADSPGGPYSPSVMQGVYEACGVAGVCRATGVVAYTGCQSRPAPAGGKLVREFTLLEPVLNADFIINLPKLKTHVLTVMSGAVKNLFGTIPGLQKAEFHMRFPQREHFCEMLVDLCETVKADLHLVDGVLAMEGDGPGSGTPRRCNLLLAGEDPYSLDLAICRYMGLEAMDTPVLKQAHARGLCPAAFDPALLVGHEADKQPFAGYLPPRSFNGRVDFSTSLPGFLQPLMPAISRWVAPKPTVRRRQCIGCGKCAEICPQQVIDINNKKATIHRKDCIHCFCCHEICPVHAIGVRRNPFFKL